MTGEDEVGGISDEVVGYLAAKIKEAVDSRKEEWDRRVDEIIGSDVIRYSTLTEVDWGEIERMIGRGEINEVPMKGFYYEPLAGSLAQIARFVAIKRSLDEAIDPHGRLLRDFTEGEKWWLAIEKSMTFDEIRDSLGDKIVYAKITGDSLEVMHESDLGWVEG